MRLTSGCRAIAKPSACYCGRGWSIFGMSEAAGWGGGLAPSSTVVPDQTLDRNSWGEVADNPWHVTCSGPQPKIFWAGKICTPSNDFLTQMRPGPKRASQSLNTNNASEAAASKGARASKAELTSRSTEPGAGQGCRRLRPMPHRDRCGEEKYCEH